MLYYLCIVPTFQSKKKFKSHRYMCTKMMSLVNYNKNYIVDTVSIRNPIKSIQYMALYEKKIFFSLSNSLAYNVTWPLFVTKTIFCGKWRSKNGLRMLSMAKRLGSMSFNSACSLFYCIAAQNCTNLYQKYTYVLCITIFFHSYTTYLQTTILH